MKDLFLDVLCAPSLVQSRKGAVAAFGGSVSPPRSSNRTCGFPASGFPTGFIARHTAAVPNERAGGGAPRARRTPLRAESGWCRARAPLTSNQEATDPLVDVVVDRSIRRQAGAVAEVRRPASQQAGEPIAHLGPATHIAGSEHIADLCLEPQHALLRRTR